MVRQRHVLLHFVHLLRVLVRGRVLLAVDDPLLQSGVDLGERHHLRDRAERLDLALEDLGGLDADLQALEVVELPEGLVGREFLEAVEPVGEPDDAFRLEQLEETLADRAFDDPLERPLVVEHVGQIEHLELAHAQGAELRHRRREHLHRAQLQRLELLAVLVELAVGVDLHLHPTLGLRLGKLLEADRALAFGRLIGDDVAELDDYGLLRLRCGEERERDDCCGELHELHGLPS